MKRILPFLQSPLKVTTSPGGQTHATLLTDVCVSVTTHCWDGEQGLLTTQGFKQVSLMQVSWGGQSLSTLHSGSSDTTAEITCKLRVRVLQDPKSATTYAQHKKLDHLLSKDICRCKPLCGLWHCTQHLEHSCWLVDIEADIPFWWNHCLGQSHISQW